MGKAFLKLWPHAPLPMCPITAVPHLHLVAVADPGFPRWGGGNFHGEDDNLLLGQGFPKNCMKLTEFGPSRGRASLALPLDPPLSRYWHYMILHNVHHVLMSKRCQVVKMSNVNKSNTWTMEQIHKKK